ncbi:hypothetical protein LXL04_014250 [Taraxacum kok-saghyz]
MELFEQEQGRTVAESKQQQEAIYDDTLRKCSSQYQFRRDLIAGLSNSDSEPNSKPFLNDVVVFSKPASSPKSQPTAPVFFLTLLFPSIPLSLSPFRPQSIIWIPSLLLLLVSSSGMFFSRISMTTTVVGLPFFDSQSKTPKHTFLYHIHHTLPLYETLLSFMLGFSVDWDFQISSVCYAGFIQQDLSFVCYAGYAFKLTEVKIVDFFTNCLCTSLTITASSTFEELYLTEGYKRIPREKGFICRSKEVYPFCVFSVFDYYSFSSVAVEFAFL